MEGRKRERQRIREKIEEKLEKKMNVVKSDFNSTREEGMVDILRSCVTSWKASPTTLIQQRR
jgi:hypothetical protein